MISKPIIRGLNDSNRRVRRHSIGHTFIEMLQTMPSARQERVLFDDEALTDIVVWSDLELCHDGNVCRMRDKALLANQALKITQLSLFHHTERKFCFVYLVITQYHDVVV